MELVRSSGGETSKASLESPIQGGTGPRSPSHSKSEVEPCSPFSAELPGLLQEALLQGLAKSGELRGQIESVFAEHDLEDPRVVPSGLGMKVAVD